MTELIKVFVYGTLKKGFANHYFMQNKKNGVAHFITTGHTKDAFPLVVGTDASIPFMLPVENQGKVSWRHLVSISVQAQLPDTIQEYEPALLPSNPGEEQRPDRESGRNQAFI